MDRGVIIALIVALFGMGIYLLVCNKELVNLSKDVSDQKVLVAKHVLKEKELKSAVGICQQVQIDNDKVVSDLEKEKQKINKVCVSQSKIYRKEVAVYKKLIQELENDREILGEIYIKDCIIKLEEVKYESDFIGNSINRIGF